MPCGKRAGVESCTSICVQLLEAGVVRAWGMSCICGGIASIGRPDANVGRLARGRSAVAHALKNVRRDCRGKPARQLPARPYVVAVDGDWAAGFVCRRVITGAGGNYVHGGLVDQPCIGDRILTPRGGASADPACTEPRPSALRVSFNLSYATARLLPGVPGRGYQPAPPDGSRRSCSGDTGVCRPGGLCGQNLEGRKKITQTHEDPNQGGQGARDSMVPLSLKPAKPSAAIAISRWQRCSNS